MRNKVTITYVWGNTENTSSNDRETLQEDAMDRITLMTKDGFTSGELNSNVSDKEYSGHWSVTKETVGAQDMNDPIKEIKSIENDLSIKVAEYRKQIGEELAENTGEKNDLLILLLKENKTTSITFHKDELEGEDFPETAIIVTLEGANSIEFRSSEVSSYYSEFSDTNGYEHISTLDDLREFLEEIELRGEDGKYGDEELLEVIEYMDSYINLAKEKDISEFYEYLVEKE